MSERSFKKHANIFLEGDEGNELYIIRSGSVNIYHFDGTKKIILAVLQAGEYFGEMALIRPGLVRSASAEASEPATLIVLRQNDYKALLQQDTSLALFLLEYTMERLRKANQQIFDLTALNARHRVIKRLIMLAKEQGKETKEGTLIPVKLTHQQMGEMVGAVRETVTKVLLELQDGGLIEVRNKQFLICDIARLEQKLVQEL